MLHHSSSHEDKWAHTSPPPDEQRTLISPDSLESANRLSSHKPPSRRKRRQSVVKLVCSWSFALTILLSFALFKGYFYESQGGLGVLEQELAHSGIPSRSENNVLNRIKRQTQDVSSGTDPLFPPDIFTHSQLRQGGVVLHILGVVYMFYALALVCDEFFVPSLDVIADILGINPDVAGATFMAAGGSAPELFTSIIGVFIAKSDVGIGTIVGSAVFNILFVIAACAFAAKTALSLTAWPLIRDVFFYSVSLILLITFFIDEYIEWYESLILLLWYCTYVFFMKFNERVEMKLRRCFHMKRDGRREVRGCTIRQAHNRRGLFHLMNDTVNPGIFAIPIVNEATTTNIIFDDKPIHHNNNNNNEESNGGQSVTDKVSGGGSSPSPYQEYSSDIPLNYVKPSEGEESTHNGESLQQTRVDVDCLTTTTKEDVNGTPLITHSSLPTGPKGVTQLKTMLQNGSNEFESNGSNVDTTDHRYVVGVPSASGTTTKNGVGAIVAETTRKPSSASADGGDVDPPIDMRFPVGRGWKKITFYLISLPIMIPLVITLPDTRNPKKRKFFVLTFLGSILWIAAFSFLMVWWATVIGDTLYIPPPVMGLTFLAAGTSVPDLITSVLVAKQGKGDMAVSSSVGSNIFDVTVGLPLPWLIYTLINSVPVSVTSSDLGCSMGLLFLMLIFVFISILAFNWKMTKGMGVVMLLLYIVFVLVTLGFEYSFYSCPIVVS